MARTVEDCARLMGIVAGADPEDPSTADEPVPDYVGQLANASVKGLRIGVPTSYFYDDVVPSVHAALGTSLDFYRSQGAEIVAVQVPDMDPYAAVWPTLCSAEAVFAHEATYPSRRDDYGPWFRGWLDKGAGITGAEYAKANAMRAECVGHLRRVFEGIDVLACPSMSAPPHPVTPEILYGPLPEGRAPKFQRFTAPFDFSGAPTLSVPCGLNGEGLPLSLQFVGRDLSEALLCQVGYAYEQTRESIHPQV